MWLIKATTTHATLILLLTGMLAGGANATLQARPLASASHTGTGRTSLRQPSMLGSKPVRRDKVVFSAEGNIYIMNTDGSAMRKLTEAVLSAENRNPTLSVDGSRIAFSSNRAGNYDIYIMNTEGGDLRRLTANKKDDLDAAWSPDGSKIAFVRGLDLTINGNAFIPWCVSAEIYVLDVEGGWETNLTGGGGGTDPAWSPDGASIAFSSYRQDNYEIYTMNANGSNVKRLTYTDTAEGDPAWSSDGHLIAYGGNYIQWRVDCGFMHTGREQDGADGPNIFVMSSDGAEQRRLTSMGNSSDPAWSPDGTHLVFVSRSHGYTQIFRIDANGQNQSTITWDNVQKASPSWSVGSYLELY
ncbi:MAG: hypothetical protein WCF57_07860 [Pyrinomonadaceae bacterium]